MPYWYAVCWTGICRKSMMQEKMKTKNGLFKFSLLILQGI